MKTIIQNLEIDELHSIEVLFEGRNVGTLALVSNNQIAFEYTADWLLHGFSISPYSLPLEKKVFIPTKNSFDGLFGVFADSLPDGWGKLLVDRLLLKHGINPHSVSPLTRLAIIGNEGMGALSYQPTYRLTHEQKFSDLDYINQECKQMLQTNYSEHLDELFLLGGSSGGARPKILTSIEHAPWIIKFPSSSDPEEIGKQEYDYALCAKSCGIIMPEVRLFDSKVCSGYFGVRRFDRKHNRRIHMISVSGLLETSHRYPNLDYNIIMKLCRQLTRDHNQLQQLFRLMCFNVFSHNQDDHGKNLSFIYNEEMQNWELSPAYDLTYSTSFGGEHATTVNGNGIPTKEDLLAVAQEADIGQKEATIILDEIYATVNEKLHSYLRVR